MAYWSKPTCSNRMRWKSSFRIFGVWIKQRCHRSLMYKAELIYTKTRQYMLLWQPCPENALVSVGRLRGDSYDHEYKHCWYWAPLQLERLSQATFVMFMQALILPRTQVDLPTVYIMLSILINTASSRCRTSEKAVEYEVHTTWRDLSVSALQSSDAVHPALQKLS